MNRWQTEYWLRIFRTINWQSLKRCNYTTRSEPILNGTDCALPACAEALAGRRAPN